MIWQYPQMKPIVITEMVFGIEVWVDPIVPLQKPNEDGVLEDVLCWSVQDPWTKKTVFHIHPIRFEQWKAMIEKHLASGSGGEGF